LIEDSGFCGESGVLGELIEGALVVVRGGAQSAGCGRVGVGELGQAGLQESGVQVGEQHGVVQSGDPVAVGARDAGDQAVGAEAALVVAHLPGGDLGLAEQFGEQAPRAR
jgi:hypothetical protein